MRIVIFHYHLKPGGVTDVIVQSAVNLLRGLKDLEGLVLACGAPDGAGRARERIREACGEDAPVSLALDPEIGYAGEADKFDRRALGDRLEEELGGEDVLWWVHNYHLGKNAAFTGALKDIADRGRQRLLLQIHDFPECGRYENLRRLEGLLGEVPYTRGPNIRYAVINDRDRRYLREAGLDDGEVFLLDNPVPLATLPEPPDREELHGALARKYGRLFPGFLRGEPLWFYPVRSIRRKNVLEAALLVRLLPERANLVVSLPGTSDQELPYSEAVHNLFREGADAPETVAQ